VRGAADKCPSQAGGKFDSNKNGCAGPFRQIKPRFRYGRLTTSGGVVFIEQMAIAGLPAGSIVTLSGSSVRGRAVIGRSGVWRVNDTDQRLDVRGGATIGLRITKPGFIGYDALLRITTTRGPVPTRVRCIPATGSQTPTDCRRVNRGK
jgi:hypothetical protein